MKTLLIAIFALYGSLALASNDLIVEYAAGIGSGHLPLTSKWGGPVLGDGSYYKEHAFRASYDINEYVGISLMSGWLDKWNFREGRYIGMPPYGGSYASPFERAQHATYIIPGVKLSAHLLRLNFGGIIYRSSIDGRGDPEYPFDGSHRFKPSFMAAIGEDDVYLYASFFNSLPMFSGGGMEIGILGKAGGYYEQKAYFASNESGPAIGYRGEFKVNRNLACALGLSIGHNDYSNDAIYTVMAGLKVRIPTKD